MDGWEFGDQAPAYFLRIASTQPKAGAQLAVNP